MAALENRIERDIASGALPPDTSAKTLVGLVMTVMPGLSVLARDGLARGALLRIAVAALAGKSVRGGDPHRRNGTLG